MNDLNIEEDIFPLLNYTNNKYAESEILKILKDPSKSLNDILERQELINGFIKNWKLLENFSYHVLSLLEVHSFFEDLINDKLHLHNSKLKMSLSLRLSEKERSQKSSQSIQLILFFNNFYKRFLARIDRSNFPENYQIQIKNAILFLEKFRLEYFDKAIRENDFSIREIVEITQILNSLDKNEIKCFWKFFFQFEAYLSLSKAFLKFNLAFPTFNNDKFQIKNFYHPLVINSVKNTIELGSDENVFLLTGPNMSGKSTLVRAIGLCVYLAHVGLGVPATNCEIPYFDFISVSINLKDDIRSGYSHFMTEIQNLKSVLLKANNNKKCFAIFDELFKGTNIDDAQDITITTLNGLSNLKGSFFFISTHLIQLESQIKKSSIKKFFIECEIISRPLKTSMGSDY